MAKFGVWLGIMAGLILAAIIVPYGLLAGGPASLSVLLFWCAFAVTIIVMIVLGILRWR